MNTSKNFSKEIQNQKEESTILNNIKIENPKSKIELFINENSNKESENKISNCLKSFISNIAELQKKKNNLSLDDYSSFMSGLISQMKEEIKTKKEIFLPNELSFPLFSISIQMNKSLEYIRIIILCNNSNKDDLILNFFKCLSGFKKNELTEKKDENEEKNSEPKNLNFELNHFQDYEDTIFVVSEYLFKDINTNLNLEKVFYYLNFVCQNQIFSLYPIFSLILHNLSKNSKIEEVKIILNYLISYKIEISTCAINNYIDCLCKNNLLEECQKLFETLTTYKPILTFPEKELNIQFTKYITGYGINIVSFGTFIKYLCKSNNFDLALYYYKLLSEKDLLKDEIIYNLIIDGCSKKCDIETLKKIYHDMINNNIKPTIVTFNIIIDAYIRNKDIQSAWKIFDDLVKNQIIPDNFTLSTLFRGIRLPSHKDYLYRGLEIINSDNNTDIILINVLLDSCIKLKENEILCKLFDNVINGKINNVKPDLITYNTFIKGCAQLNLYDKVTGAFELLLKNDKIKPNDVTFNTLIDVFVRAKDMNKVWFIISKMKEYGIKPDNFTYSTIIKGLNKNCINNEITNLNNQNNNNNSINNSSELDLAFKLFDNVKKTSKPDEILYNCIMDACLRFGKIDQMLELYENMLNEGIKPSSITCGIVIKAYGMKGNLEKALEMYDNMKKEKIEISSVTYGCLINACIKNNDLNKALLLYKELQENGFEMNTILYTTLIKAYSKVKDLKKVLEIFSSMKNNKNNPPNNITYNSVIDCAIKCNQYDLANKIFSEMLIHNEIKPDIITFSTLIKGEIRRKNFDNAIKYLDIMLKIEIKPDDVLLNSLLDGCEKCKEFNKAFEIYNLFKSKGVEPTMMTYSIMMKICGRLGNFEFSKILIEEVKKKNQNLNLIIFTCYIKTCFSTDNEKEAIDTFKLLNTYKIIPDNVAYATMINGITNSNDDYSDDIIQIVFESIDKKIILQRKYYISVIKYLKRLKFFDKVKSFAKKLEDYNILTPLKSHNNNNMNINNNNVENSINGNNENCYNDKKENIFKNNNISLTKNNNEGTTMNMNMHFNFNIDYKNNMNRERNPLNSLWTNNFNMNKIMNPNTNFKGMKYNNSYNNFFYNNNYMKTPIKKFNNTNFNGFGMNNNFSTTNINLVKDDNMKKKRVYNFYNQNFNSFNNSNENASPFQFNNF